MHLRLALALPLLIATLRSCSQPAPVERASAVAFQQSVGVNVHLEYDGTPYADPQAILASLRYLGVDHVRDAAFRSGVRHRSAFDTLAAAGVRFDLFFNRDLDDQVRLADGLAARTPRAIVTLEGPNESNNEGVDAGRPGDLAGAQLYQGRLRRRLKMTPALGGLPLLALTTWPPAGAEADAANFHSYPRPDQSPARRLAWERRLSAATQPAASPVFCTETGYTTGGAGSLSPQEQAEMEPLLLLENFRAGVVRTYLYELYDGEPEPVGAAGPDRENHFGLFDHARRPKPVADALRRLLEAIMNPPSEPAGVRPPVKVEGSGVHKLSLTRSDGGSVVVVWPINALSKGQSVVVDADRATDIEALDLATGRRRRVPAGRSVQALARGATLLAPHSAFVTRRPEAG